MELQKQLESNRIIVESIPTMNDGVRGMKFIEKCVESHKSGNVWLRYYRD